ncbi:MAG: peptidylprolyl isomerase [Pseudomonadota bacterium]
MTFKLLPAAALLALSLPVSALDEPAPAPSPNEIVSAASQSDWVQIAAEDMLVMTLAPPDQGPGQAFRDGHERKIVIQLMPAPFSQGWVENIRTLARAQWYDGISVNRVQDNYVVQWGDPNHDNPEAEGEAKPLPEGLNVMRVGNYLAWTNGRSSLAKYNDLTSAKKGDPTGPNKGPLGEMTFDQYAPQTGFHSGWPIGFGHSPDFARLPDVVIPGRVAETWLKSLDNAENPNIFGPMSEEDIARQMMIDEAKLVSFWPVHCYGMVGVGRSYSPDTGSGAELYTVIGHAPRHLDRNIALAGRIISGMEHLSSLPRGSGALGFYTAEEAGKRTPILSIRVASDLPEAEQPRFEYLSTETESFARYAEARANRRDPFFIVPAGGADICNIPVPIRAVEKAE